MRARSSTACRTRNGRRSTRKRRRPIRRPRWPPHISTDFFGAGGFFMANVGGIAGDRLRSFIERIERLEDERRALGEDIREVYSEAKGAGFDVKIMRQIVRIRKLDQNERDEQEALLETYMAALGMANDGGKKRA